MTAVERLQAKRVRDRNYRFRRMPPHRQRVRIARDVLAALAAGDIHAGRGQYFLPTNLYKWSMASGEESLHRVLSEQKGCRVCVLGAAFVCAVMRADRIAMSPAAGQLNFSTAHTRRFLHGYLNDWFSSEQLGLIEAAFEASLQFTEPGTDIDLARRAVEFGVRAQDRAPSYNEASATVMRAIMENIIQNNGEFVP